MRLTQDLKCALKKLSKKFFYFIFAFLLSLSQTLSALADPPPLVLPTGVKIINGDVSYSKVGNYLNFNSSSTRSIINYNTFSIGSDAGVIFNLPNASSSILNRVVGISPSEIFGSLVSNGRVFLVNPNGIFFSSSSNVNVNSLFASTLTLKESDFLAGKYVFLNTGGASSIVNKGSIQAKSGGVINLFASAIDNQGTISAPNGQINLAVGDKISFVNNGLAYQVVVDQALKEKVVGFNNAISNSGSLKADGGLVRLQSSLENNLYDLAVNNSGLIQAKVLAGGDGFIELITDDSLSSTNNGHVLNTGEIASSGTNYLQVSTLENFGKISSDEDVNILALGTKTITRNDPDGTLIHSPWGDKDWNLTDRPAQTITFSILNQPNSKITAGRDLNILSKNVFNTSGLMQAARDLNIKADLLLNERAGFYTEYIPTRWGNDNYSPFLPYWEDSDDFARYEYWLDRQGDLPAGTLSAGRDLSLVVKDTINKDSLIEAGNDLNIKGNSFTNTSKVLMGTMLHIWRANGSKRYFEPSAPVTGQNNSSSVLVGNDANFDLEGNFNNSSIVAVNEDINVKAANANIGILDKLVQTPQLTRLPSKLVLPFWEDTPFDSDFNILDALRENVAGDIRNILFNLIGKTYIGSQYKSAKDTLAELEANRKAAMLKDPTLVWGEALTPEQIANLDGPILWYEIGPDGKERMVVYIPSDYQAETSPEGLMTANNINFEIKNKFYNSGTIVANNDLDVTANEILNEARTVTRERSVRVNTGLFRGRSKKVYYEEIQAGGNMAGNNVNLTARSSITNRGGTILAADEANLDGPIVSNEAQKGSEVITWKSTFADKLLGNKNTYSLKPVFQGANITANTVNIDADVVNNIGSDIYGEEGVSIKATDSVNNSWITGTYTTRDNFSLKFSPTSVTLNKDMKTAHVTQSSSIGSGGDVEIETKNFTNVASDVYAGNDINIQADNINITDAVVSSNNRSSSASLSIAPQSGTVTLSYQNGRNSVTTHQSSNFVAGNDIDLSARNDLSVTGSNLLAGNTIALSGENVNIQNGLYTDTNQTTGGSLSVGRGNAGVRVAVSGFHVNGSQETLTPSLLQAKNIEINADNNVNFQASIAQASDSIDINAQSLNVNGQYERANSENFGGSFGVTIGPHGPTGADASVNYGYSKEGRYQEGVLQAPNLNLNVGNAFYDGANLNGQQINPHSDYSEAHQFSASAGVGSGSFSFGLGMDNFSLSGGAGNNNFLSAGYGDFSLGAGKSTNSNGSHSTNLFGSAYGTNFGLSQRIDNPGILNSHPVWTASASYGGVSLSGDFQHGELKQLNESFLFWNNSTTINDWDYTCFVAGTPISMADGSAKAIEDVKAGDQVLSWNENTGKLESKAVLNAFRKNTKQIVQIQLANKLIETTPDHPFYTKSSGWVEAGKININDKLFDEEHKLVSIVSLKTVDEIVPVYNLEIEDNHTYFAHGVLVHNVTCYIQNTPDGGRIITDKDGKILADFDLTGNATAFDRQSLQSTGSEEAQATLQSNPVLNAELGTKINVAYDSFTGEFREIIGYTGWESIPAGNGYSGGTVLYGDNLGPIYGQTLGTWQGQGGFNLARVVAFGGSIYADATVGSAAGSRLGSAGGAAGTASGFVAGAVVGGIAGGASFGGSLNLIDQLERNAQTAAWGISQPINWGDVGKNAGIYGALGGAAGGIFAGTAVAGSLSSEIDAAINRGVSQSLPKLENEAGSLSSEIDAAINRGVSQSLPKLENEAGSLSSEIDTAINRGVSQAAPKLENSVVGELKEVSPGAKVNKPVDPYGPEDYSPAGQPNRSVGAPNDDFHPTPLDPLTSETNVVENVSSTSLKIDWGSQNKHIPGHNNFQVLKSRGKNPSELTYPNPQELIDQYAGTGQKQLDKNGNWNRKEIIQDFGQPIGYWVNPQNPSNRLLTQRGTIHYDGQNGVHIVPAHPIGK